ncbi:MAG: transglycosylase SLT domain-containing protein [Polyangiaceae bacterium]|nr:transglycosylase SLT domain-containing protein [Polyangiaceae bacterium]
MTSRSGEVAVVLALLAAGCGCSGARQGAPAPSPAPPGASIDPAALEESAVAPAPTTAPDPWRPVLADPRLAAASALAVAGDPARAADALEAALAQTELDAETRAGWSFQLAKLHTEAHRPEAALTAYLQAIVPGWALAPWATCLAAKTAVRVGRHDEALRLVSTLGGDGAFSSTCRLAAAEAHVAKREPALAIALYRAHLASSPRPARADEVSLSLARLLLSATPPEADDALALARRVAVEHPTGSLGAQAADLEDQAVARLSPEARTARASRSLADEVTRASALFEAGKPGDGAALAEALSSRLTPDALRSPEGCKLTMLVARGRAQQKARAQAADGYGEAISRCAGDDRAWALYRGGVASAAAKRPAEALARFEQLEREQPKHRLADDARVKGADAALALGDEARFTAGLSRIADDYPDGDLVSEGLFRLALQRIDRRDWAGAVAPLEISLRARPDERDYAVAGRAAYCHARARLATGERARAVEELSRVVVEHPLAYYGVMAHARLAELDPPRAAAALEQAKRAALRDPARPSDAALTASPAAARAVELLRQGELELARLELAAAGLTGKAASPAAEWALARLYLHTGHAVLAHGIPRSRVTDWLTHWPEGEWRAAWELAYPRPYLPIVTREAARSGIPVSLAYAIMREESAFDPGALSGSNAVGLMQLILPTAKTLSKRAGVTATMETLRTPAVNVALGCLYLGDLRERWSQQPLLAIPSYNAGPNAPARWLRASPAIELDVFVEKIPFDETRAYTKRVVKSYAAYLALYEPERLDEVLRTPLRADPSTAAPAATEPAP